MIVCLCCFKQHKFQRLRIGWTRKKSLLLNSFKRFLKNIFQFPEINFFNFLNRESSAEKKQWDDLYDMSEKENFVQSIRKRIEQSSMEEMLLDENLQRKYQDINLLRNRVIRNLYEILSGACTEQEIEKAFEKFKKSDKEILDMTRK